MNGIYFGQGATAAKTATCLEDAQRVCPHGQRGLELHRRQVWMNGFIYGFDPAKAAATAAIAKHTLHGQVTVAG
jgi:hypothetical protein